MYTWAAQVVLPFILRSEIVLFRVFAKWHKRQILFRPELKTLANTMALPAFSGLTKTKFYRFCSFTSSRTSLII